jgi:hypothetical protein
MTAREPAPVDWRQVVWPRPLSPEAAAWLLRQLAAASGLCPVAFQTSGEAGTIQHLIGTRPMHTAKVAGFIAANLPDAAIRPLSTGALPASVDSAAVIRVLDDAQPLDTGQSVGLARSVLTALAATRHGERLVVQVTLWRGLGPRPANQVAGASWGRLLRQAVTGKPPDPPDSGLVAAARTKAAQFGFVCRLQIGVTAPGATRREQLAMGLLGALRSATTSGTGMTWRHVSPQRFSGPFDLSILDRVWPDRQQSRLGVDEIGPLVGWPLQTARDPVDLPGLPPLHPRLLPLPGMLAAAYQEKQSERVFAVSNAPATFGQPVGLSARDNLTHLSVCAPTGAGKSTLLHHLVKGSIDAGESVVLLDPKGDLVEAVLTTIPKERQAGLVVLDPTDGERPVGFNPLRVRPGQSPELVADAVTATIAGLWPDTGVRTLDVLSAAVSTLTRLNADVVAAGQPNQATLLDVPRLLTDQAFRSRIVGQVDDEVLAGFWAGFMGDSARQRAEVIAPVMRRLRQFLSRRSLRNVLGQAEPRFDLGQAFAAGGGTRVVLVPLNKAQLGAGTAQLFGALVVSELWNLTLGRAALPTSRRAPVSVVLDEAPDLLRLPLPLGDALAQARGLGVGFTLAAQFRSQWPANVRDAVDANALSKVCFRQPAADARAMAAITGGQVEAEDFMTLGQYEVFASLARDGHPSDWFSARTLPPPARVSDPRAIRQASRRAYGQTSPRPAPKDDQLAAAEESIGRARRTP